MVGEQYRQHMESAAEVDRLLYEATDDLVVNCEQLLINSWGDVHCQQYSGNRGILQCLCDWTRHAELKPGSQPAPIHCYGYSAGVSTFWAQRIAQVYDELLQFFYHDSKYDGRFIIRMGPEYFLIEVGGPTRLYNYLEQANKAFRPCGLERYALIDTPLRGIFQRNRQNVVQVFYQLQNGRCYTWVVDEKGSLWREQQDWFDRSSYVAHWLYLMRNIRNRLKRINYQNRDLPSIEIQYISSNQLGGLEFHPLGGEAITSERGFIDIRITVEGDESGDRISLNCDGREFSYQQYQQRAITECVQHIIARMAREGRKPVYVTDIDVPLRLYGVEQRDAIQVSHFLKYKRNIEHRLNQLIEA
jgi:adenylate cyclase class 1